MQGIALPQIRLPYTSAFLTRRNTKDTQSPTASRENGPTPKPHHPSITGRRARIYCREQPTSLSIRRLASLSNARFESSNRQGDMAEMISQVESGSKIGVATLARYRGRRQVQKPNLRVVISDNNCGQTSLETPLATPSSILTPPLTPSYTSASSLNGDSANFHNYLRVMYDFSPSSPISSVEDESSVTVPINQGDTVLVHTVQPNGWADGTLLNTGSRGWLPTNYCKAYDHEAIRVLLDALTYAWEFIRGNEGEERTMFTRQDYVRYTIAGVRVLLERSGCLNRDSATVSNHAGLRRLRKGLLGDLSAFAKAARSLQDACQEQQLLDDEFLPLLDAVVLRAFKVVTRAVRFLDVWILCVSGSGSNNNAQVEAPKALARGSIRSNNDALTTPPLSAGPGPHVHSQPSPTRTTTRPLEHSSGHSPAMVDSGVTLHSAHSAHSVSQSPVSHTTAPPPTQSPPPFPPHHGSHHHHTHYPNGSFSSHTGQRSEHSTPQRGPPSSDLTSSASSSHPSQHSASTSSNIKRTSASHRASHTYRTSAIPGNALASERLHAAHDSFLGSLGAFIGNHIQSRSSMDLLVTTQQSVVACQTLLKVVEEIWERDSRRSLAVDDSRFAMHARLAELVHATKDIFEASSANSDSDAYRPEQGRRLMDAATMCVRGAGDCVTRSCNVVDRIGDFDFEPIGLGLAAEMEQEEQEQEQEPQLQDEEIKVERHSLKESEVRTSMDKPLPLTPGSRASQLRFLEPTHRLPLLPTLTRERASSSHSDCTDSTMLAPIITRASLRSSSLPRSPTAENIIAPSLTSKKARSSGIAPTFLTLDIDIPHTSFIDMTNSPTTASPEQSRFERADSAGESVADSTQTYWSSVRHSDGSDRPSTRATTPDPAVYREPSSESLNGSSISSSQDTDVVCGQEVECVEAQMLVPTHAHELVHNKNGQVTGGSLPALVERLTTHDSTPDALYVNTFYLTFRLFTTPLQLAQCLIDRFDQAADDHEFGTPIRLRVYNVFKSWLETCWRPESDNEALPLIQQFANGKLLSSMPPASRRLNDLATLVIETRHDLHVPTRSSPLIGRPRTLSNVNLTQDSAAPNPIISKSQLNALRNHKQGTQICTILDLDPMELARQFTIKQSKIFCAIQPEELLALEWTKKTGSKAVNVLAMSSLSTDLANLVADTILQLELKKRAVVIKQWVKIANKCLDLGNYDALMAIICSLNSSMVLRLKKTWDLVSPKTLAKLDYLKTVVDVSRNYAVLRQRLQTHCAPCLPFVGIYLTDLTFVDVGNHSMRHLPGDGCRSPVINFDKQMKTAKIIGDLQRFQIPYRLNAVAEMQDWMDAQIGRVSNADQASVQNYYRRSLMLEPRENMPPPPQPNQKSPSESASSSFSAPSFKESARDGVRDRFEFWGTKQFLMGNREKTSN